MKLHSRMYCRKMRYRRLHTVSLHTDNKDITMLIVIERKRSQKIASNFYGDSKAKEHFKNDMLVL